MPKLEGDRSLRYWKSFYSGSSMLSCLFASYTQLQLYKALCVMANHPQYFEHISDAAFWSSHDPTFTLPIGVMIFNYVLLSRSSHPFLVNIRQNWSELARALLVIYGSALTIVLPQSYLISYLAFGTSHLAVRWAQQKYRTERKPTSGEI